MNVATRIPRRRIPPAIASLFALAWLLASGTPASALITGGEGNEPIGDPGWPKGAAAIFNHTARVAWWEGPPFGGGQWHAECRGDTAAFNTVLADFAKLDMKSKRVIVRDGVGHSFWLNPNREPAKSAAAKVDWVFMVWQPANWEHLRKLPADLNPTAAGAADQGPPTQIDVYVGGNVRWSEVQVPLCLDVVDERLEAHGFTPADGTVLSGQVLDLETKQPLAAKVKLQRVEPQKSGGYHYPIAAEAVADAQGRWTLKHAPTGSFRIVVAAEGYVARVVGYPQVDDQPRWYSFDGRLAKAVAVSGSIADDAGKPLADVEVRLANVAPLGAGRYETAEETGYVAKSDATGQFRFERVPAGTASVWLRKAGYCRPGLGAEIKTPNENVALQMQKSAEFRATVDFSATKYRGPYIVQLIPEGGEKVGKWSGSGHIDAANQIAFHDVPPGRYVVSGHPNPSAADQHTPPQTIDLKPGATTEVTVKAK